MMRIPSEIVREWFDRVWNNGEAEFIDVGLAECCELTGLTPQPIQSRSDFHQFHQMMNNLFEDIHVEIDHIMESGDSCSGVVTVTGTHRQSGRAIQFQSSFFGRIEEGKICHAINLTDYLSVLVQIGALPADAVEKGLAGESAL
ncbi:MAG: ester cyclase [Candidatus Thiodiazotropha endolucinida]